MHAPARSPICYIEAYSTTSVAQQDKSNLMPENLSPSFVVELIFQPRLAAAFPAGWETKKAKRVLLVLVTFLQLPICKFGSNGSMDRKIEINYRSLRRALSPGSLFLSLTAQLRGLAWPASGLFRISTL
jgi:hypothetical protein